MINLYTLVSSINIRIYNILSTPESFLVTLSSQGSYPPFFTQRQTLLLLFFITD